MFRKISRDIIIHKSRIYSFIVQKMNLPNDFVQYRQYAVLKDSTIIQFEGYSIKDVNYKPSKLMYGIHNDYLTVSEDIEGADIYSIDIIYPALGVTPDAITNKIICEKDKELVEILIDDGLEDEENE